jgi:three-Cys-motif partner protein
VTEISTVGPWAREKLDVLGRYLSEYTKILRKWPKFRGYFYIDAFAGSGLHRIRAGPENPAYRRQLAFEGDEFSVGDEGEAQFVEGSPRVALEIEHPFSLYIFIDRHNERANQLQSLQSEYAGRRDIKVISTNCNEYLLERFVLNPRRSLQGWRGVVFLDPFGMQVPWRTIAGIADSKVAEVILNFPVGMAIQRMLRRDGQFSDARKRRLDEYLGSPDWFKIVYRNDSTLFGLDTVKVDHSGHELVRWYAEQQLGSCFKFVTAARLIRNSHGGHLYYLIHAGHNATGHRIAEHIMKLGEAIS